MGLIEPGSATKPTEAEVIVAGGGIAGIAAALRLAQNGIRVLLLETRKKLGGRATSFTDVRTGETLDNCQHVTLGCCVNYLDLLRQLGVADKLTWYDEQHWIEPGGRRSSIRPALFPAPLHFSLSVLRARFLSLADITQLALIGPAILRVDRSRHRNESFGAFLRAHHQSQRLIDRFWAPVVVSACNLSVDKVAASSALHVFQEGFFANAGAASIGISRVPLVELYDRALPTITAAGGEIRLGCGVETLTATTVTTTTGEVLRAKRVICALPVERARDAIDASLRDERTDPRTAQMQRFEFSPILGVHLTFDRPVMDIPHAVLVLAGTQWLFRKDDAGTKVHAVISAADDWMPLTEEQIAQRVVADLHAYFPASREAKLLTARPVKEKRATFAPTSTVENNRPAALNPLDPHNPAGLVLAGDYTDTGWPATMEGATRSGYTAAAAVMSQMGNTQASRAPASPTLLPDLQPAIIVRALQIGTQ